MTIAEAADFLTECETLDVAISGLTDLEMQQATQFKGWTIEEVLVHLHYWNHAADLSATDADAFKALAESALPAIQRIGFRAFENAQIVERGAALRDVWIKQCRSMARRWADMDPKMRVPWAGPSMSARSSMTARIMETWAHGFEVFDALGLQRRESDRIRNVVTLGANTFGWSHQVHGLAIPDEMPLLHLEMPSGEVFEAGNPEAGAVRGKAVEFAAVVTQTRAFADTALRTEGDIARTWMLHAQCFAGPPVKPPAPGTRHKAEHA
jgi:uncharacterized protein (TIGR03084 family)